MPNFFQLFPIERGRGASCWKKVETPLPNDNLCQVWLKLLSSGSGEVANVKFTDWQTDAGQKVIRKARLGFQLRWAKKNRCYKIVLRTLLYLY